MENLVDIVSNCTRGLIIGNVADPLSYRTKQYYDDPQDNFWPLVYQAFGKKYDNPNYKQKLWFLRHHRIGLCYTLKYIDYMLLDSECYSPFHLMPRDLREIFLKYPDIQCLFFNGFDANRNFNMYNKRLRGGKEVYYLPSSDGHDESMSLEEKQEIWRDFLTMTPQYQKEEF